MVGKPARLLPGGNPQSLSHLSLVCKCYTCTQVMTHTFRPTELIGLAVRRHGFLGATNVHK